jgi:hypothetical protein
MREVARSESEMQHGSTLSPGMQRRIFADMVRGLINDGRFSARNRREAVRFATHMGISQFEANVMIRTIRADLLGESQPPMEIDIGDVDPCSPESIKAARARHGSNAFVRISIAVLLLNLVWFYWLYRH